MRTPTLPPVLDRDLDRWVDAGLIVRGEADAIHDFEQHRLEEALAAVAVPADVAGDRPRRRVPVVAEALGYLGGTLGIAGIAVMVGRRWMHMGEGTRLLITGVAATLLVVAGGFVREHADPALLRLRSFAWAVATAIAAVLGGTFTHDVLDATDSRSVVLGGAVLVTALSGALWFGRHLPVQEGTMAAGALVGTGVGMSLIASSTVSGATLWVVSLLVATVGLRRITTDPWVLTVTGSVGAIAAGLMVSNDRTGPGLLLASMTTLGVLAIGVGNASMLPRFERVLLMVVGGFSFLQVAPATIVHFADRAGVLTGGTIWLGGTLLLMTPVMLGRSRTPVLLQVFGGVTLVAGAAITGAQSVAVATTLGLITAIALLAVGTTPGYVLMSLFGCIGLLVNVPWAIQHFFPGEGRVPLLISMCGLVLVGVAVLLTRMGGRFRRELRS